jgi:hypothetical protein
VCLCVCYWLWKMQWTRSGTIIVSVCAWVCGAYIYILMCACTEDTALDMRKDFGAQPYGAANRNPPLTWASGNSTYCNERPISTQQVRWSVLCKRECTLVCMCCGCFSTRSHVYTHTHPHTHRLGGVGSRSCALPSIRACL